MESVITVGSQSVQNPRILHHSQIKPAQIRQALITDPEAIERLHERARRICLTYPNHPCSHSLFVWLALELSGSSVPWRMAPQALVTALLNEGRAPTLLVTSGWRPVDPRLGLRAGDIYGIAIQVNGQEQLGELGFVSKVSTDNKWFVAVTSRTTARGERTPVDAVTLLLRPG